MLFKKRKTNISLYTKFSSYRRKRSTAYPVKERSQIDRVLSSNPLKRSGKFFLYFFLLAGLIYVGYLIFFSETFIVTETALFEGETRIDHDVILSEVNVYKGKLIFSVQKSELTRELIAKYPEIEKISIKRRLPNKLYVYIEKYPEVANLQVYVEEVQRKYVLNTMGTVSLADAEDANLPYIVMDREKAYNSREQVMTGTQLEDILKAQKLFEQKFNMKIIDILYLEKAREYHLRTEKNFSIWLDMTQDYKAQLSKLKAAEQKLNIHTTPLAYIDLRIAGSKGEKVIFMRK